MSEISFYQERQNRHRPGRHRPGRHRLGRYAHLSQPLDPLIDATTFSGPAAPAAAFLHRRTLLFMLIALLVGAGLFMLVPDLSASPEAAQAAEETTPDDEIAADAAYAANSIVTAELDSAAVGEPVHTGGISPIFTREVQHWAPKIMEWSAQYNLDPDIIATIMQIESCGDPGAASYAGAQGLFQVMPFHFDPAEDMLDPDTNARRGMAFYNRQLEYTGWDIYLSFAGYNGGYAASGGSYDTWANETQRYFYWAKGIYDEAKTSQSESPTLQQWLAAGGGGGCQRAAQRLGI